MAALDKVEFKPKSAIPNELKPKLRNAIALLYGEQQVDSVLQHVDTIVQQVQKNRPKELLKEDFNRPHNWHQFESVYSFYPDRFGTKDGKPTTFKALIPMLDYLKKLNELYNRWIESYKHGPILIINVDKNRFPEKEEDLGEIIGKIDSILFGLF